MKNGNAPLKIEISNKTLIFIAAFLIGLWLLAKLISIIIVLILSFILLSALLKPVQWLTSKRIPRVVSVLIIYVIIILLISVTVGTILPPLISQTTEFSSKLPQIISSSNNYLIFHGIPVENLATIIANQINKFSGDIVAITSRVVSSVVLLVTMFVLTFYLLLDWKNLLRVISSPFSGVQEKRITNIISKTEDGLGRWVRGQIILSLAVGILTYIGLTIIGIAKKAPGIPASFAPIRREIMIIGGRTPTTRDITTGTTK